MSDKKKIKIAIDLDGVIIDKPPFIPKSLMERLFRGEKKNGLRYRFPTTIIEQIIRIASHHYLFRPPIRNNIEFIQRIFNSNCYEIYIVSGRYSFLKSRTEQWLIRHKLNRLFKKIYLNIEDDQPHFFKEKILKIIKPAVFIDDDDELVNYLSSSLNNSQICFFSFHGSEEEKNKIINFLDSLK